MSDRSGYTLIELLVTVIIIAVISGLAINNYIRALQTGYERDIIMQIRMMQNALEIEERTTGSYPIANLNDRASINTALKLQIPDNNFFSSYQYTYFSGSGTPYYVIQVTTTSGWAVSYDHSTQRYYCSSSTCPTCTATSCS